MGGRGASSLACFLLFMLMIPARGEWAAWSGWSECSGWQGSLGFDGLMTHVCSATHVGGVMALFA